MGDHRITVLPGDGTGREVALEAQRILDTIQANTNHGFDQTVIPCGGQHYLSTGEEWAPGSFEFCRDETDAIFLGAIGQPGARLPNGDLAGGSVILGLRSGLDLYANVRPVLSFKGTKARYEDIDIITVRENTQGMYSGLGQIVSADGEEAEAKSMITREGAEKIVVFAYELARREGRKKVTAVHKANILKATSGLFLKVAREVAERYPDIESTEMIVDNACMQLVMNPHQFDVIVTTN